MYNIVANLYYNLKRVCETQQYRTDITRKEKVRNDIPHFLLLATHTILLDMNENSEDLMKL